MSQRVSRKQKESWKSVVNLMNEAQAKKQYNVDEEAD